MPSAFTKPIIALAALVVMLLGAPAFAQSQSSSGDPFSGVQAVDSDQMSAVSGEQAGGIGAGTSMRSGTGGCGAGAQCAGGLTDNTVGTTRNDVSVSGNTVRISVTAINNQTVSTGPGIVNTGGGLNTQAGGGAN